MMWWYLNTMLFQLFITKKTNHFCSISSTPLFLWPYIIKQTLDSIIGEVKHPKEKSSIQSNTRSGKVALFIQHGGKCTEDLAHALHKINAPCTMTMTRRKLKTVLPSLKPPVAKMLKRGLVYRLTCPRHSACYVGETRQHLKFRVREHIQRAGPIKSHLFQCRPERGYSQNVITRRILPIECLIDTWSPSHQRAKAPD